MGRVYPGLGAALCDGPGGGYTGPHPTGPADSQHDTRRRTRGLEGDGGYISRGTSPEGTQPAGQSDPNYLSDRWLVVASLDLGVDTGDAQAPRVWGGDHRY